MSLSYKDGSDWFSFTQQKKQNRCIENICHKEGWNPLCLGPTSTSCEQGLGLTSADKQSRREDGLPTTTLLTCQNLGCQDSDPVF